MAKLRWFDATRMQLVRSRGGHGLEPGDFIVKCKFCDFVSDPENVLNAGSTLTRPRRADVLTSRRFPGRQLGLAYSGAIRSTIPGQGDHRFRRKAIGDSGLKAIVSGDLPESAIGFWNRRSLSGFRDRFPDSAIG